MNVIPKIRLSVLPYNDRSIVDVFEKNQLVIGPHIALFESGLANVFGYQHANTTSSGFAALFLALKTLKLEKAKVVVPVVSTCHAMTNAVLANGFEVVFCDIDPNHLSLSTASLSKLFKKMKFDAIIAPSHFGIPAPIEEYKQFGVPVIEDACQAFFTRTSIASSADIMVLSFYPTKQLNCIEGGAVLHNSHDKAMIIEDLRYYDHQTDYNGRARYNLRMPNLHAAFGIVQMDSIKYHYENLIRLRDNYCHGIEKKELLIPAQCDEGVVPWRFLIKSDQESVFKYLSEAGIQSDQEMSFLQSETWPMKTPQWFSTFRSIPFFSKMTKVEQNLVIQKINEWC
jgi:dTDP-4-amino-4,6-dideoxygalactose transaminase